MLPNESGTSAYGREGMVFRLPDASHPVPTGLIGAARQLFGKGSTGMHLY